MVTPQTSYFLKMDSLILCLVFKCHPLPLKRVVPSNCSKLIINNIWLMAGLKDLHKIKSFLIYLSWPCPKPHGWEWGTASYIHTCLLCLTYSLSEPKIKKFDGPYLWWSLHLFMLKCVIHGVCNIYKFMFTTHLNLGVHNKSWTEICTPTLY